MSVDEVKEGSGPSLLMVTGEYPPWLGGVGDYTARLSTQLARAGARVAVLTSGTEAVVVPSSQEEAAVHVMRAVPDWGFDSWHRVADAAFRYRARLVHIQYQSAAYALHLAVNLLPGYLRLRLSDVKVVTTFHDLRVPYLFPKAGALRRAAVRALDKFSNASVTTNQPDLDNLGGTGRLGSSQHPRRWLIPLGSNVDNAPPSGFDRGLERRLLGVDQDTLLLSYFGLLNSSKGVEFLLEALGLLARQGVDCRLLIVGGATGESDPTNRSYAHRMLEMVKARQIEDRVIWTGYLETEQVSAALLASDLCVLPFRDGASLRRGSLLAALLHGLPIVTTHPIRPETLFVNGENMIMVKRDDPPALAAEIQRLWSNPELRDRLAQGAKALATRFAWSEIAARHLQMYGALLS